jgi:hypothetical protein
MNINEKIIYAALLLWTYSSSNDYVLKELDSWLNVLEKTKGLKVHIK